MIDQYWRGARVVASVIKNEVQATWAGGSRMDRLLMVAFALFVPYDVINQNWFDAAVAVVVLTWVWQSVKQETTNDQGGGCACGVQKVCNCEHATVPLTPKKEKPVAQMQLELDLGPMMREAMISSVADIVDAVPQYRFAVVLELLKRDPITRMMIAEAMGEAAIREHKADEEADARMIGSDFVEDGGIEKSWDEIMLEVLAELVDTPGGRGEALPSGPDDDEPA